MAKIPVLEAGDRGSIPRTPIMNYEELFWQALELLSEREWEWDEDREESYCLTCGASFRYNLTPLEHNEDCQLKEILNYLKT